MSSRCDTSSIKHRDKALTSPSGRFFNALKRKGPDNGFVADSEGQVPHLYVAIQSVTPNSYD
jgi:hypothetical protein